MLKYSNVKMRGRGFTPLEIAGTTRKHKENKSLTGFTLIELLVAISVFSIVIGITLGTFISGIRQQRIFFAGQAILDQTSYVLEYMGRALRMARKGLSVPGCLSSNGLNYEIPLEYQIGGNENLGTGLRFINYLQGNDCQEFYLQNGQLKYQKDADSASPPPPLDLTSGKLEITSFKFNLSGASQTDNLQPRLTVFLEVKGRGELEGSQKIRIQTTISQRNLDVLQP